VRGWEIGSTQALSLEGRSAPEEDTEKRAVQVLTAADKGESAVRVQDHSLFVQALVKALSGEADLDKNGWLMASELGRYVNRQVADQTKDAQHPVFTQLEGDGDTIMIEGRKAAFRLGGEPQSPAERQAAARMQYEQAFAMLQSGKSQDEALECLNKALEYDPTFGDAYVLKSYVRLEVLPNIDEALAAGKLAVQYAPNNPDSHYTLGLIYEKRGQYAEAEKALRAALVANPNYVDVYFTLGVLYADDLKDQKKAVEAFERYLELGGSHSRAHEAVAQSRAAQTPRTPAAP
jgi:tetratricopeptide (TPR) repeat protein